MKKLVLITILLFAPLVAYTQCSEGSQCVPNAVIDRATAAATELAAARQVIEAFSKERTANEQERASAARLIDRLNAVILVQDRLNIEYNAVIGLYKETIKMYAELVEKMTAQLNKPRSVWAKFLSALKTITVLIAGVTLGRGL